MNKPGTSQELCSRLFPQEQQEIPREQARNFNNTISMQYFSSFVIPHEV
jgi:hypothetical protein